MRGAAHRRHDPAASQVWLGFGYTNPVSLAAEAGMRWETP